ncbi:hypothetical protein GCM10009850_090460 [Nonomuraea monospora]|uniref:Tetratricopeptide repeat protein n=1 Tax=Nonomuraea monospora TaxID=568818 RepID=A0ABP5PPI1_9ACTN
MRLAGASGNDHERLHAEVYRATYDQHLGEHSVAGARFGALLPEFRRIGDLRCAARCLLGLGRAAAFAGEPDLARRHLADGVRLAAGLGDTRITAAGLRLLADADHAVGHFERAATLLGAAERLAPEGSPAPGPHDAGTPAATHDAGAPAATQDANAPAPTHDASAPTATHDAGVPIGTPAALRDLLGQEGFDSAFSDGYRRAAARLTDLLPTSSP